MNNFLKSIVGSHYFTLIKINRHTNNTPPSATFVGWMTHIMMDRLTRGSNETHFNLFFGELYHLSLTMLVGGGKGCPLLRLLGQRREEVDYLARCPQEANSAQSGIVKFLLHLHHVDYHLAPN